MQHKNPHSHCFMSDPVCWRTEPTQEKSHRCPDRTATVRHYANTLRCDRLRSVL